MARASSYLMHIQLDLFLAWLRQLLDAKNLRQPHARFCGSKFFKVAIR